MFDASALESLSTLKLAVDEWKDGKDGARREYRTRTGVVVDENEWKGQEENGNGVLEVALRKYFDGEEVELYRKIQLKRRPEYDELTQTQTCPNLSKNECSRKPSCVLHESKCVPRPSVLANEVLSVRVGERLYLAKVTYENHLTHAGSGEKWRRWVVDELDHQARASARGLAPAISRDSFFFDYDVDEITFQGALATEDGPAEPRKVRVSASTNTKKRTAEVRRLRGAVILMENAGDDLFRCVIHNTLRVPNFSKLYGFFAQMGAAICELVSEAGVIHEDMHLNNVRVVSKVVGGVMMLRPVFIDFGLSSVVKASDDVQAIVRSKTLEFYDRIKQNRLLFLSAEENGEDIRQNLLKTVEVMRKLHEHTVCVERGTKLFHTFNYDSFSKTGYVEDPRTRHANTHSFFVSKLNRVPAMFFAPEPVHETFGRKSVELVVTKNVYNVLDVDNFRIEIDGKTYAGFDGLRKLLASRMLESLWDATVFRYRKRYLSEENEKKTKSYVESDMPLWAAFGKLFNGWRILRDEGFGTGLEKQITLTRRCVSTRCAFVLNANDEKMRLAPVSDGEYENIVGVRSDKNNGGSPAYAAVHQGGAQDHVGAKDHLYPETTPAYSPTSPIPAYSPTSPPIPAYSELTPEYSPTSPA